ncbi:MAG TPA: PAS domain-containing sensor histidine kinase, partial [Gemmataceae bacterium]|nr:PAS domain-containing sensor histidine kinase [Gemmataceae bacterium]
MVLVWKPLSRASPPIVPVLSAATAPLFLDVLPLGGCSALSLLTLLLGAIVSSAAVIRIRHGRGISVLSAVLVPTWLTCGGAATAWVAPLSAFAGYWSRSHSLSVAALHAVAVCAGTLAGSFVGSVLSPPLPLGPLHSDTAVSALLFVLGYWGGEHAIIQVGERVARATALAVPRSNFVANLLLLFPGSVLAQIQMQHGFLFSGPLLLLLVLALWLITLYVGASTEREGAVIEQARLQSVVAQVPDAVVLLRPDLRIQWVNEAGARLAGWIPSAAVGRTCGEVFRLADRNGAPIPHRELLAGAAEYDLPTSIQCELRTDDGHRLSVLATYSATLDESGAIEAGALSIHPQEPAERADERAAALAHELRSPLTSITLSAEMLGRTSPSDHVRQARYLAAVTASGEYVLRLVNNMLDLQAIAGGQALTEEQVHLDDLVHAGLAMLRPKADEKRIHLSLSMDQDLPIVQTNELLLRRAVDNLLSNAVKYTPSGGS